MTIKSHLIKRIVLVGLGGLLGLLLLGFSMVVYYLYKYDGRIYPNVQIENMMVGGLTKAEAIELVMKSVTDYRASWPIVFKADAQMVEVTLPETAATYLAESSIESAYELGRQPSLTGLMDLVNLAGYDRRLDLKISIDNDWLTTTAASVAAQVDIPTIPTSLEVKTDKTGGKYTEAIKGQKGVSLNQAQWMDEIRTSIRTLTKPNAMLMLDEQSFQATDEQIESAVTRANNLLLTQLILSVNPDEVSAQTWELPGSDLVRFVKFDGGYDEESIADYVNGVAEAVNRAPKDAKFQFDETNGKVSEFVPAEDGVEVIIDQTTNSIVEALIKLGQKENVDPLKISVKTTAPTIGLNEVNRLGIREKLGEGTSTYWHSILSRVHNVELAANRLNGTLIKPGEEFSFNAAVGEVSAATGYQAAYVIRNGRTELGDGGGLCQDSTTVFRAVLDSGLPVTERRGHSYRVGYYEQNAKAGLDATVYAPSTDLKFVNDTPAHILIQTEVDSPNRTLKVIFYGTSDGRKSSITDHVVWGITPALPDVFQDDPTLPVGTVKQVDWKAAGAKAKFTYSVERDGQIIYTKTFVTTYQPWASVFLKGTKQ